MQLVIITSNWLTVFQVHILGLAPNQESDTLPSTGVRIVSLAKWTHNYIVANMVTRGNHIYIGDAVSSLSVVKWDEKAQALVNVARDYAPLWPTAIETLDSQSIIGCNVSCVYFLWYFTLYVTASMIATCLYSMSMVQLKGLNKWETVTLVTASTNSYLVNILSKDWFDQDLLALKGH